MVSGFPSIADGGLRKSILGPQLLNERVFGTHTKRLSPVGGIINCHRLAKSLGYTPTTTAPEGVCTPDPLLKNAARRCLPSRAIKATTTRQSILGYFPTPTGPPWGSPRTQFGRNRLCPTSPLPSLAAAIPEQRTQAPIRGAAEPAHRCSCVVSGMFHASKSGLWRRARVFLTRGRVRPHVGCLILLHSAYEALHPRVFGEAGGQGRPPVIVVLHHATAAFSTSGCRAGGVPSLLGCADDAIELEHIVLA